MIQSFLQIDTVVFAFQKGLILPAVSSVAACLQWASVNEVLPSGLMSDFPHVHITNGITQSPNNLIPQQL